MNGGAVGAKISGLNRQGGHPSEVAISSKFTVLPNYEPFVYLKSDYNYVRFYSAEEQRLSDYQIEIKPLLRVAHL